MARHVRGGAAEEQARGEGVLGKDDMTGMMMGRGKGESHDRIAAPWTRRRRRRYECDRRTRRTRRRRRRATHPERFSDDGHALLRCGGDARGARARADRDARGRPKGRGRARARARVDADADADARERRRRGDSARHRRVLLSAECDEARVDGRTTRAGGALPVMDVTAGGKR